MTLDILLREKGNEIYFTHDDATILECVRSLGEKNIGVLMVLDDSGRLEGIVSERDIIRKAFDEFGLKPHLKVKDIMIPRGQLVLAAKNDRISDIMQKMSDNHVRHIPVMDEEKVVGLLSIRDVIWKLLDETVTENRHMKDYIYGHPF
ncbi:MAG: CBS domain-containing protein [Candidatus Omnitrophica bacterium]|nr:CBS domain-containing protein [Candidatus Omnitrophota bacterium]MDD5487715.1 CBS domain-containing protein [Candidatus Omnitrophota bacterium]